ncbi:MAG: hypothetical protein NT098_05430 [Candidatus Parcubacteria bacterium]|nr:hypothetical protein [Candidatus Parcubacteria bacterium]
MSKNNLLFASLLAITVWLTGNFVLAQDGPVPKPPTPVYTGGGTVSNVTYDSNSQPTQQIPAQQQTVTANTKTKSAIGRQCIKSVHGSVPMCSDGWGGNGQPKATRLNNQYLGICSGVSNTGCDKR